jgi:uroporphyrinogen-III synthase
MDDALAREADRRGVPVLRLALLDTLPGADGARFLKWLRSPPDGAAVAWTSRRAGERLAAIALPRSRDALAPLPLLALGAESAAPARDAGLPVETPPDGDGAAAFAEWIARRRADRKLRCVAFLHGDKALSALPDGLRAAGIDVAPFEVYRTRFLSPDVRKLKSALEAGGDVAIAYFSPSGVDALERLLPASRSSGTRDTSCPAARRRTAR